MLSPSTFRDLASGRRRGLLAATARLALAAASVPYGWAVARRNRRFDRGLDEIVHAGTPVVSIGNLTVGGTGKTPMVEWLARELRAAEVRVAILSRGYKAGADGRNDEALELELALPDVPHLQSPDRAAAAAIAVEELGMQMLVLDDGFQHRRLARDLDVVLIDATEPLGVGGLLPRGTLREPAANLARAHAAILSRAEMLGAPERAAIRAQIASLAPQAAWCEVEHRATAIVDSTGRREPLDSVRGKRALAFCGIGNPAGFRHTVAGLGLAHIAWEEFPDHHDYEAADVQRLAAAAKAAGAEAALCTRKDLVKLRTPTIGGVPLGAVEIGIRFLAGENALKTLLAPLAERARTIAIEEAAEVEENPFENQLV